MAEWVEHPVSPRGTLALMLAGKARAYLHGRDHVVPEDVTALENPADDEEPSTETDAADATEARGTDEDNATDAGAEVADAA